MENEEKGGEGPIFRDIRRYYCDYCGICRSKKALITSHVLANHQDDIKKKDFDAEEEAREKLTTCEICGKSFQKPAHLKQHMQSHSLLRPFVCSVSDCGSSYRRKDHLNRHMLTHEGKLFDCPVENCKSRFTVHGNIARHVKEFHSESTSAEPDKKTPIIHKCEEEGCGKAFPYPSKLRKHVDSHVKLDCVEALCTEPGCLKYFSNEKCLKEHISTCHQYVNCKECGSRQLKKNIKRHMRTHESGVSPDRISCSQEGCSLTFSTASNLKQHVKAVHMELKPYKCCMSGCNMRFAFKHVRDNHCRSGIHVYTHGDFQEWDEQFRSRPRGGRKRKYPLFIDTLLPARKRVVPPNESHLQENDCPS